MKLIRNSFAAGIAFAALTVAACSSQHGATGSSTGNTGTDTVGSLGGNPGSQGFGSVGMHLNIGPLLNGATVYALNWTISNGTNTYTGTNTVGDAQSFEFVQGGIAAGTGYTVSLSGTDTNGDPCGTSAGAPGLGVSSTFSITAGAVTQTTLAVNCVRPTDASTAANVTTGTVEVDAAVGLIINGAVACPGISSFSISPAEIIPGQTASLTLITTGPASTLTWSAVNTATMVAGGGTFGSTSAPNTTFVCDGSAAQVAVTATIGLPDSGLCAGQTFTTQTALINCEGPVVPVRCPTVANPNATTDCTPDAGTATCVNTQGTDINNCGGCGVVCPAGDAGGTAVCTAGVCSIKPVQPTCVAECPASNPGCTNGENQGIGFPGCNATEALFNAHTPSGSNTTGLSCLQCVLNAGCLHDNTGDVPPAVYDCEDVSSGSDTFDAGSATNLNTCLGVLGCELPSDCGKNNALYCYCGEGVNSTTCKTSQTGACAGVIGFGLESSDPVFIQNNFSSLPATPLPGQIADKALLCARNNCQAQCF